MSARETTFAHLISQGLLAISDGYRAKNDELGGDGPIFLRAGHVTDDGFDFVGVDRFARDRCAAVRTKLSQVGDVVITTKGNSTGRVAYVTTELPQFVYSPHLSYWRSLDHARLAPGFLRYWSRSQEFHDQLGAMKASTDMAPYLSLVDQRRLRITVPDADDQHAIAEILGALDDKIESNRRTRGTIEQIAHTQLAQWEQIASNDPDPSRWQSLPLDKCGVWVSGGTPSKSNPAYWNGYIPWISAKSMHDFVVSDAEDRVTAEGAHSGTRLVPPGAAVFVVRGMSLATEFRIGVTSREVTINQDLKAILPRPGLSGALLGYALQCRAAEILEMADEASHGTKRLQTDRVAAFTLTLPSDVRLTDQGQFFDDLFGRQAALHEENVSLGTLRDALLPRLLSGELHVRDAASLVAAVD